jgi:hypothetical protein
MHHTTPPRAGLRRAALWGGALVLLLMPALAMQFSDEVRWGPGDFAVFGVLLALACLALELIPRVTVGTRRRWLLRGAVVLAFLLVWAELAVGLFH